MVQTSSLIHQTIIFSPICEQQIRVAIGVTWMWGALALLAAAESDQCEGGMFVNLNVLQENGYRLSNIWGSHWIKEVSLGWRAAHAGL